MIRCFDRVRFSDEFVDKEEARMVLPDFGGARPAHAERDAILARLRAARGTVVGRRVGDLVFVTWNPAPPAGLTGPVHERDLAVMLDGA